MSFNFVSRGQGGVIYSDRDNLNWNIRFLPFLLKFGPRRWCYFITLDLIHIGAFLRQFLRRIVVRQMEEFCICLLKILDGLFAFFNSLIIQQASKLAMVEEFI